MRSKILLGILMAAALGLSVLLIQSQRQLIDAKERLVALQAERDSTAAQNSKRQGKILREADLKRMEQDSRDAIKLRGELNQTRAQLEAMEKARAEAEARASKAMKALEKGAAEKPEENPYLHINTVKSTMTLPLNHGLVMEFFRMAPGKKTYAIAIPEVDPSNPKGVVIETKWVEFAEANADAVAELLPKPGEKPTMTPEQVAKFLETAEKSQGFDLLSGPRISTASGVAGTFSISSQQETPAGTVNTGPEMHLTPTLLGDGTVHIAVEAKMTYATPPEESSGNEEEEGKK